MLPFFTPFEVDVEKHTLKPYMAPVNHKVLNETAWINIVHTFMENFWHESDSKIIIIITQRITPFNYLSYSNSRCRRKAFYHCHAICIDTASLLTY
jgi:hypothetical protein